MGKLATPQNTEPISFWGDVSESDGGLGSLSTGEEELYSCLADVEILKGSRPLEAAQVSLRQGYRFGIWVNPAYEPKPGHTVRYYDERLTIQDYRYKDSKKLRYLITAIEQQASG